MGLTYVSNSCLGIDPGKNGGLAVCLKRVSPHGSITFEVEALCEMPDTEAAILSEIEALAKLADFAVIERAHSMPKQGVKSTFTFGETYGFLKACLYATSTPFIDVPASVWQKALGVRRKSGRETKYQHKKRLLNHACQLYPSYADMISLATCDAILLAHYGLTNAKELRANS